MFVTGQARKQIWLVDSRGVSYFPLLIDCTVNNPSIEQPKMQYIKLVYVTLCTDSWSSKDVKAVESPN